MKIKYEAPRDAYSEHLGMRVTPLMLKKIKDCAKAHNLPTAIFARWVLLNYVDEKLDH